MARYIGPKNKLARREGIDLGLKTPGSSAHASLLRRLKIKPGQHGQKIFTKLSSYGQQLREKQKVKRIYGILEKQFKRYYQRAAKFKGITAEQLLRYLEQRLDNVAYRLNFVPTRTAARQIVSHGHILVNGQKVDIPSYQVKKGQVISLKQRALKIPIVKKALEEKGGIVPRWLKRRGPAGKVVSLPRKEDIAEDINEQLIIEYYSR